MEIIHNELQTVASNQNVVFDQTVVKGNCAAIHREGSGLVTLRGITDQCRARFRVSFGANVAIPTGGAAVPIELAIAINGEAIGPATMISTPAAVANFNNVYTSIYLDVPVGCCYTISVTNIGTDAIEVENANLIVERVA